MKPAPVVVDHRGIRATAHAHRPPTRSDRRWAWRSQHKRRNILSARLERDQVTAALVAAIDQFLAGPVATPPASVLAGQVLDWWVAHVEADQDRPLNTRRGARSAAIKLIDVCGRWQLADAVSERGIERIGRELRAGLAQTTVALYLRQLRAAAHWSVRRGIAQVDVARMPENYRAGRLRPARHVREPTPEELWAVLDELEGHRPEQVAIYMLGATGARVGEVVLLLKLDVHPARGIAELRDVEGAKTGGRFLALPAAMAHWWRPRVEQLLQQLGDDPRLIPRRPASVRKWLRRACAAADVEPFTPKGLRIMVSNALFDAGADPGIESLALGHTPQTAQRHYRRARARRAAELLAASGVGVRPARRGAG